MTRLEVRVRYGGHGMWVHTSLLGWIGVVERAGSRLEIRLPKNGTEFSAQPHELQTGTVPAVPSATIANTFAEPDWDHRTAAIHLFVVAAYLDSDLPPERPDNPLEGEYRLTAEQAFDEGKTLCDALAYDFMRWVRATARQAWLGTVAEPPHQYGRGGLYYADSGEVIFGSGPTQVVEFKSSRSRLEPGSLEALLPGLASEEEVPVAQELLADAWHMSTGADVPDLNRAVLLAAIACEIKTKDFLRQHADPTRQRLLSLALKRTSTLHTLLDEVCLAALDVSLKDSVPALYEQTRRLTTHRNNIVHKGRPEAAASDLRGGPAQIAQDLFDWFDAYALEHTSEPTMAP